MNREDAQQLFREVKANLARLDGCAGHRFEVPAGATKRLDLVGNGARSRCTVCGGDMPIREARLYNAGVLAGSQDPSLARAVVAFEDALNAEWERLKG